MKKGVIIGLIAILLLPILIIGCAEEDIGAQSLVITTEDFMARNHLEKKIEVGLGNSLTIDLGANPTTGFQWAEDSVVSDTSVLRQVVHNYIEPEANGETAAGSPGKAVWVFDCKAAGTSTVELSYSRPWDGGEKDVWTLKVNVTVR